MDKLIHFAPKKSLKAAENLDAFTNHCRENLSVFGIKNWDDNRWETFKGDRKVAVTFSKLSQPSSAQALMMDSAFLDFAKSYIKYIYSAKPVASMANQILALRVIEAVLLKTYGQANILLLDGRGLAQIPNVVSETTLSPDVRNKMGYQLEAILDFCRSKFIVPSLPEWKNPYPKKKDMTIGTDKKSEDERLAKMPSDEEMYLLADFFREAPNLGIEAEYYSSIFVFLMLAPNRVSELLHVKVDPFVYEEHPVTKDRYMGVQWYPAKGADSGTKWVPRVLEPFVLEAHDRLVRIGQPARDAAKFAIENPNSIVLPNGQSSNRLLNPNKAMSVEQFCEIMGRELSRSFPASEWVKKLRKENHGEITYKALAEQQYKLYTSKFKNFPKISTKQTALITDSLLLTRANELHKTAGTTPFSFMLPTIDMINERLSGKLPTEGGPGKRSIAGKKSLLEEFGFKLSDGTFPKMTTHQPRHWVSTKAESAGVSDIKLAQWAGRARVRDNDAYDHRTQEEKSREAALIMYGNDVPLHVKAKTNMPILFREVGKDLDGAAILTELGLCIHDYSLAPCGRHGDCETCKDMVCIKGFSNSLEKLKRREKEVTGLFEAAKKDHEIGKFGSDRWVSTQGWRLAHIKTKIRLLTDERIPDGTPIKIPDEYDPSPIKEALKEKNLDVNLIDEASNTVVDSVFKLMNL